MQRENFSSFVDKAFWAMLLGVAGYGVHFLSELNTQIRQLNEKMAIVIERSYEAQHFMADHEYRIANLENRLMMPRRPPHAIPNAPAPGSPSLQSPGGTR